MSQAAGGQERLLQALKPRAIIERLGLERPGFRPTASLGHFGRDQFAWERPAMEALLGARGPLVQAHASSGQAVVEGLR